MVKDTTHRKMKIAYVFSTLAKTGGTERMITEKANYYAEKFGYDVTIVNLFQQNKDANHYPLSNKVKQINIGIPYFSQYHYKYPKRLWFKWKLNRQLKHSIKQYVQKIDPDILIGISFFNANHISKAKCEAKKIVESHEAKLFTYSEFNTRHNFSNRIYKKIRKICYFRAIERNADAIVTLTEGDKMLWKRAKRVEVIPNFSSMYISQISDCTSKRVIAVGRLAWEKGFDRLIEAWSIVCSKYPDWHLDIYGEGRILDNLKTLAKIHNAYNLTFHPNTPNISQEYAKSSICAVTSYFEGFSLIMLEAMKHGVPCVAFDCPFGPSSIINDASCGFLVENGDTQTFAERLCRLIEDVNLRIHFSKKAIERAKCFDTDIIMNQWKVLLEELTSQKQNE